MKFVTTVNAWLDRFIASRKHTAKNILMAALLQLLGVIVQVAGMFGGTQTFGFAVLRIAGACILSCTFLFCIILYLHLRKNEAAAKAASKGDT